MGESLGSGVASLRVLSTFITKGFFFWRNCICLALFLSTYCVTVDSENSYHYAPGRGTQQGALDRLVNATSAFQSPAQTPPWEAPLTFKGRISLFSCKTNFLALLYTKIPQSLPWWFSPSTGGGPRTSGLLLDCKAGREVLYLCGSSALHTKEPGHLPALPLSQPRDFSLCSTQCPHLLNRRKNRTLFQHLLLPQGTAVP